jgi:hypothetical protein
MQISDGATVVASDCTTEVGPITMLAIRLYWHIDPVILNPKGEGSLTHEMLRFAQHDAV